ncbi:MAG: hypothetical protein ACK5O7_02835 [Holosporales bacterium]
MPKLIFEVHENFESARSRGLVVSLEKWLLRHPNHCVGIIRKGWSRGSWLEHMRNNPLFAERVVLWHVRATEYTKDTVTNLLKEVEQVKRLSPHVRFFVIKGDPDPADPMDGLDTLDALRVLKDLGFPTAAAIHPWPHDDGSEDCTALWQRTLRKIYLTDHLVTQVLFADPGYAYFWEDLAKHLSAMGLARPSITLSLRLPQTLDDIVLMKTWGCWIPEELEAELATLTLRDVSEVMAPHLRASHAFHKEHLQRQGFDLTGIYLSGSHQVLLSESLSGFCE